MAENVFTRRDMIAGLGALGLGSLLKLPAQDEPAHTVVHMTDFHHRGTPETYKGIEKVVAHVLDNTPKDRVLLLGGDLLDAGMRQTKDETLKRWADVEALLKPFGRRIAAIGNHDVFGWGPESGADPNDPLFGKAMAMDRLGLPAAYYREELGNWRVLVLDSIRRVEDARYQAYLEPEQLEWFEAELALARRDVKPVLVLSHAAILSVAPLFPVESEKEGFWRIPADWMHIDGRKLKDLLAPGDNVKLCLSGHMHLLDRVDYARATHMTTGAVCGAWWNGSNQETPPGYAVVRLWDDGRFERTYVAVE